jgi:hypothetical protein
VADDGHEPCRKGHREIRKNWSGTERPPRVGVVDMRGRNILRRDLETGGWR